MLNIYFIPYTWNHGDYSINRLLSSIAVGNQVSKHHHASYCSECSYVEAVIGQYCLKDGLHVGAGKPTYSHIPHVLYFDRKSKYEDVY